MVRNFSRATNVATGSPTPWMPVQHCCVALPLAFHFSVHVNRLEQQHWMHELHFPRGCQASLQSRLFLPQHAHSSEQI